MGRGDKRTRRGKIFKSSYGNTRPQGAKSGGADIAATNSKVAESVKKAASGQAAPVKKTTSTKKTK